MKDWTEDGEGWEGGVYVEGYGYVGFVGGVRWEEGKVGR